MSKAEADLDFTALLARVLHHWPESVDVSRLSLQIGRPDSYVVIGLGAMGESITAELDTNTDAVLLVALSDTVTSAIRSAAQFCTIINPKLLRPNIVRDNFEKRLRRTVTNPDLGWKREGNLLIERYFSINKRS
ncbi:hypothetical protein [Herbaspirillum sp. YR522]|uniref:hypothetical protein n=1 Tax=Herbaspirillum sp. YR522 TaxID=1144342 RepID=UPI0012F8932C|nr:hypothetical protein [Herbaspirillum sp. YR522]